MGHAIYSVSDPRAEVLKGFVESLAKEKGRMKDYQSVCHGRVDGSGGNRRRDADIYKGVSANVDFYSGFVYSMLDLPLELVYTDVCGGAYRRLECTSNGRADQYRQDHPSGIQERSSGSGIRSA